MKPEGIAIHNFSKFGHIWISWGWSHSQHPSMDPSMVPRFTSQVWFFHLAAWKQPSKCVKTSTRRRSRFPGCGSSHFRRFCSGKVGIRTFDNEEWGSVWWSHCGVAGVMVRIERIIPKFGPLIRLVDMITHENSLITVIFRWVNDWRPESTWMWVNTCLRGMKIHKP